VNATVGESFEKRLLMIAFHYPPCRGSSGLQRALSFSRYLPVHGWGPTVLTVNARAYPEISDDQLQDVPITIPVKRAFALDTARHLSFKSRYLGWLALPDRWVSWVLCGVPVGLQLIQRYQPKLLWSTYPIATAHLIGFILHRLTGIPWVADFRDPMTEIDAVTKLQWPSDPRIWKARRWIERLTMTYASRAIFVTPGALRMYAERYPNVPDTRWAIIPNGYDEDSFVAAERISAGHASTRHCHRLLHSGVLYPTADRDPSAFFAALAKLRAAGKVSPSNLSVILRASGHDHHYRKLLRHYKIEDIVHLEPPIPYRAALSEMLGADGLLIFQGYTSNPAIPAKFYEYLRARRPIFAMVDAQGDTASALKAAGVGQLVPLTSEELIMQGLLTFLHQLSTRTAPIANLADIKSYSRATMTQELAGVLDAISL
jgi:Glycosyl transferase 4-like domain